MSETTPTPLTLERDGTGQAKRQLPDLMPTSVGIDERSLSDLLGFSAKFAEELKFFDPSSSSISAEQDAGNWRGFLNPLEVPESDWRTLWQDIETFLAKPEQFSDDSLHRRPHFVLFLSFLQLLGLSQQRLNRIPQQHLDFYYQQFLGLVKQSAQPDRVNVLIKLSADASQVLLPKGSLLDAGKDSQGNPLHYATDEDLLTNRAQVKSLFSVFVDKKITGIKQAREACIETSADPMIAMFSIVYGEPIGAPAPPYLPGVVMDAALFGKLHDLVALAGDRLFLNFQELSNLMRFKSRREQTADADWHLINGILNLIGLQTVGAGFNIEAITKDPWDFDANLKLALNGQSLDFDSLAGGIKSMEDLYWQRHNSDALDFIRKKLHLELDQFTSMMEKKMAVDQDWRIVNGLLEAAGQRQRQDLAFHLPKPLNSPHFADNLQDALGKLDFSAFSMLLVVNTGKSDFENYYAALQHLQDYFYCSLEDFKQLATIWKREQESDNKKKPSLTDWNRAYVILTAAYNRRYFSDRLSRLTGLIDSAHPQSALVAMLRWVLAEPNLSENELQGKLPSDADNSVWSLINDILLGRVVSSPTDQEWQTICTYLEQVWRNRDGVPPLAQKIDWLNLYANSDASSQKADSQGGTVRWHTFGQGRKKPTQDQPPAPLLGWAIESPVLCLSEGLREITLTLAFQDNGLERNQAGNLMLADYFSGDELPFQIEATTSKGWLSPDSIKTTFAPYKPPQESKLPQSGLQSLTLSLQFNPSAPPLVALSEVGMRWPTLRMLLKSTWQPSASGGQYMAPYPPFHKLILERVFVATEVQGLKNLMLENDNGSITAGKPFEPFGFSPATGARLQFVHPELVIKRLDWLQINLEWMNVPAANLANHYRNYPDPNSSKAPPDPIITANSSFQADFCLVDHHQELSLKNNAIFDKSDAAKSVAIKLDVLASVSTDKSAYVYGPELGNLDQQNPSAWPRFWRMELSAPDFQHGNYAAVSAAMSVTLASDIANSLKPEPKVTIVPANYRVNPPYTPKLKSFGVDYHSSLEIVLTAADTQAINYGKSEERLHYYQAFGTAEIQPDIKTGEYHFLPSYDYEGELYIGLENVVAPQVVSLLFQMAEGSANPDLSPQAVEWSYLSGNQWLSLHDGHILSDTSIGLIQSGIIKFQLSEAEANTLLPADLYWLRAAVKQDAASLCDTIAILAQAVSATWIDRNNAPDHLSSPLPAETIRKTVEPLPGIAAIIQPYTSFGGKTAEQDQSFNLRVSERLRHKQRALSLWDYEHLVLERFPGIYKVKCIPVVSSGIDDLGKVSVVVIPDIRGQLPFNPFEPKATAGQIAAVDDFLQDYLPPSAQVRVVNAHYVPVRVRFAVRFMPDCDPGYYKPLLNEELNRFLSPWAYQQSSDVSIGGTIYANAIVDFLERRPYVDYIAELKLFKNEDGLGYKLVLNQNDASGYRVQTDLPDGVLVADRQHDIDLIVDAQFQDEKFTGVGYMKIELDFVVSEQPIHSAALI